MTTAAVVILWVVAGAVALPMLVVAAQCLLSAALGPRRAGAAGGDRPRCAVLVPAHDEEGVIGRTLGTIAPQLKPGDRLIVVADNCSDGTAVEAAAAGAEVVERRDATRRGKGYALAAGVDHLRGDPPAVVVTIDADCSVEPGALDALAAAAAKTGRAQQAIFLMYPPDPRNVKNVISAFAFMVKNLARPAGMDRLGLPVPLTGSGMAFPWVVIAGAQLASGDLVEDLSLGLDLAARGEAPMLCPRARVTSMLPESGAAAAKQRTRWEHGYLQTLLKRVPYLLAAGVRSGRPSLIAVALDLAPPPLSLLVTLAAAATAACVAGGALLGAWGPTVLSAAALGLLAAALFAAWARFGRGYLPARALLGIPLYLLWKLPIYLNFVRKRETQWVRTERATTRQPEHKA